MRAARIGVPATSVWHRPDAADRLDSAVTRGAPDIGEWATELDTEARHALLGRLDTQALLGEPALVVAEQDEWAQIRLPWQPSTAALDGYPGWVPTAHLIDELATAPLYPSEGAVVTVRLADAIAENGERLTLSFGTVLPFADEQALTLRHPDGRTLSLDRDSIAVPAERGDSDFIDLGQQFVGLPYLWAGLSGHGVDCSGFVHLAHRVVGRLIPRDAHDQALVGTRVEASAVRAGDIVYFENDSGVHHTGFALDRSRLLHSPRTGKPVGYGSIVDDYPGELYAFRHFTGP